MQLEGCRYDTGELVAIEIEGDRITSVRVRRSSSGTNSADTWIAPGLVDLQVNGFGGQEFNDPELTVEKVERVSRALDAQGVTGYCPTATTHSFEVLQHTLRTIAAACDRSEDVARRVVGIHLEGPYITAEDGPRGAHPRNHCRPPDWDEFQRLQEAAGGKICLLTMSPEYENAAEFVRRAADAGVLISIGHTSADSDQIRAAVDAGARMSTHLGNGAHGQIRRHPNYIWDQLAEDRLVASLIVDGHHLPAAVVKTFIRAKTPERCVLVSDITGMAGMPPGRYERSSLGDIEVLEDGRLVIAGQRQLLAGAALPMTVGIANVMHYAGVDLKTAVDMASARPAELLGLPPVRLEEGALANLILFRLDDSLEVLATINRGELIYGHALSRRLL